MKKFFSYNGYEGTAEIDLESQICRGKILFIDDLVTYQADSPKNLEIAFQEAVDDYLDTCATLGREPLKPLKGLFNVRVPPEIHKALVLKAIVEEVTLNEVVVRALTAYVSIQPVQINHTHNVLSFTQSSKDDVVRSFATASAGQKWSTVALH